jgi:hypothetical protein
MVCLLTPEFVPKAFFIGVSFGEMSFEEAFGRRIDR